MKNYKSRYSRYAHPRKSGLQVPKGLRQDDSDDPTRSADLTKSRATIHTNQPPTLVGR